MKKRLPYIKKVRDVAGFHVWYINGYWIRKHLDREFTNFGQHHSFKFIPENEFWIDKGSRKNEIKYFVETMLLMNRLMKQGYTRAEASKIADIAEMAEREKTKGVYKLKAEGNKIRILKRIRKKFLEKYSGQVRVWLVRGDLVRSLFYPDFTQGGHDKVYDFIPSGEVWIDDDVYKKEWVYVIIHELYERYLMTKGLTYDDAHTKASKMEYDCRHHPKKIKKKLNMWIKKNRI